MNQLWGEEEKRHLCNLAFRGGSVVVGNRPVVTFGRIALGSPGMESGGGGGGRWFGSFRNGLYRVHAEKGEKVFFLELCKKKVSFGAPFVHVVF